MMLTFKLEDHIDKETGLFNPRPYLPVSSAGNILEVTGKLFIWMSLYDKVDQYKDLIQGILEAYRRYEVEPGFIPRTVAYQENEPQESEPNRWELAKGVGYKFHKPDKHGNGFVSQKIIGKNIDDAIKERTLWIRTDASHSQWWYFWTGIHFIGDSLPFFNPEFGILDELEENMEERLLNNKFVIKRLDGKPSADGSFFSYWPPIGNAIWRAKSISHISGAKLSWWQKRRVQANLWAYKQFIPGSPSDIINTVYTLYSIKDIYRDLYREYLKFVDLDVLRVLYLDGQESDKVRNCLDYLNIKKMKNMELLDGKE
jgi:hypothetical protein